MSAPMTFPEFRELLIHIHKEHSPLKTLQPPSRKVVYVHPDVDMRTGTVFAVRMRGYGQDVILHTQNEEIDNTKTLLERCHAWLDGAPEKEVVNFDSATRKLMRILVSQFGDQCSIYADEFGSQELTFKVSADLLRDAIKEKEDADTSRTTESNTGSGEPAGGHSAPE